MIEDCALCGLVPRTVHMGRVRVDGHVARSLASGTCRYMRARHHQCDSNARRLQGIADVAYIYVAIDHNLIDSARHDVVMPTNWPSDHK